MIPPTYTIPDSAEKWCGYQLRVRSVRKSRAEWRMTEHSPWGPAALRLLAKDFPVDSELWIWLRSHGVRRPSPSGPSGPAVPRAARSAATVRVELSLAPDVAARLREAAAARGVGVSAYVTGLV